MASRVVPGGSWTTDRSSPSSRLNSVDLPTLGRPTRATRGMPSGRSPPCPPGRRTSVLPRLRAGPLPVGDRRPTRARAAGGSRRRGGRRSPARGGRSPSTGPEPEGHGSQASASRLVVDLVGHQQHRPARSHSTRATSSSSVVIPTATSTTRTTIGGGHGPLGLQRSPWRRGIVAAPSHPPVSTTVNGRPFHSASSSRRSRVTPGPLLDHGGSPAHEPVHEGRLPHVGPTGDHHHDGAGPG